MPQIAADFLAGNSLFSYVIERCGGILGYSHVASVIKDKVHGERYLDARCDVIAGVPAGVHVRAIESERWTRKRRVSWMVSDCIYAEWEANLRAKVTTLYDRMAILGFLEGSSMHTAGRWICSALFINSLQHVGMVRYPLYKAAHELSPNDALLIADVSGADIGEEQYA